MHENEVIDINIGYLIQFNNGICRSDGTASVSHAVPDFLTSYTISAFAIHPVDGLGIATSSSQVSTFLFSLENIWDYYHDLCMFAVNYTLSEVKIICILVDFHLKKKLI